MEFALLGWPADSVTLELDWQRFAYAGKFVMSSTGKAIAREDGDIVGAAAFDADRTDEETLWIRYVTVANDEKGQGIGARLCAFVRDRALERGYARVAIGVNNPFSYEALYKAGFAFTGEETGMAELVLEHPGDRSPERYFEGFDRFRDRELSEEELAFLDGREGVPDVVDYP
ncbi:GNAT family N-acetyltransferase [Natronomonas sp. EA1]|uniref:GNAT family N-acetyltransferase n=1 Tax=Natronomonas sp. EA1 TaxID=3421655 RepID=UPI003EBADEB4